MSLDGFVAGPNPTLEEPLDAEGNLLHEWAFAAASWRGLEAGETNPSPTCSSGAGTSDVDQLGCCTIRM